MEKTKDYTIEILLFIVLLFFIVFKLANVVDWPYWLVLSPIWIYLVIKIVISLLLKIVRYLNDRNFNRSLNEVNEIIKNKYK